MELAWFQHSFTLTLVVLFPWFSPLPLSPPETQPSAVAGGAGVARGSEAAKSVPEEPLVLPGVVIEEIPKGSALEKAGLQVGDVILSWERLPNPTGKLEPASGKIESPFDWMWLEMEQITTGGVMLFYARNDHVDHVYVLERRWWGVNVVSSLAESVATRFAAQRSQLEETKGEVSFTRLNEDLESLRGHLSAEIISAHLLALGDLYRRFSRWEDADRTYQAALLGVDDGLVQAMIASNLASLCGARAMISEAITLSKQAKEQYRAAGAYIHLARELQRLAKLYIVNNAYPQAIESLDEAVEALEENSPGSLAQASVLNSRGGLRRELGEFSGALSDYEAATRISRGLMPCGVQEAVALVGVGNIWYLKGDFGRAEENYREALSIYERVSPGGLLMAGVLSNLANIYHKRGDNEGSLLLDEHGLRIRMTLAPGSLTVAESLNNMGLAYGELGDLQGAESFLGEALRIRSSLAPGSQDEAETLMNIGLIALKRDDFERAISLFTQAKELVQPMQQQEHLLAGIMSDLGNAKLRTGDLVSAEIHFANSLEILNRIAANDLEKATVLMNLGSVSFARADYELAGERYRKAAGVFLGLGRNSREASVSLANLGSVAYRMNRLEEAAAFYKESLAIEEKIEPQGTDISRVLASMVMISIDQGRLAEAEALAARALLIARKNERPLGEAGVLINLGEIAMAKKDYRRALNYYTKSLERLGESQGSQRAEALFNIGWLYQEIGEYGRAHAFILKAQKASRKFAPDTWFDAEIEHALGGIAARRGEFDVAEEAFRKAVLAIEKQMERFEPQPSDRRRFRDKYRIFYGSLLESLVSKGDLNGGFAVSERGRGQSFLETLSMRRLELELGKVEAPGEGQLDLGAIEARKMQIAQALSAQARKEVEPVYRRETVEELIRLRQEFNAALRAMGQSSSSAATVHNFDSLGLNDAIASLEPTTVGLSYWVSEDRTFIFVINKDGVQRVHIVPIDQKSLRERIQRFRSLMIAAASRTTLGELRSQEVNRLGRELYRLLVFPAERQIEAGDRLLIVPDGPLHYLPFGALVRAPPEREDRRGQYLAEWKPFHSALSVTLFGEIKKNRRPDTEGAEQDGLKLIAFGAPEVAPGMGRMEPDSISDLRVRSALRSPGLLEDLPFGRREVEGIVALYNPEEVQVFIGADATEERAKAVGKGVRILHFATHARLNDLLPLDSGLVLNMPQGFPSNRDNGLLQVWEIFEKVRLDADLVVLSACDTGLGEEQGGEGLIGLTRAFQYAGAHTVMASLWSVQDRATSELMIRFYKHLRAGLSKDEALRQAQIELIRGPIEVLNEKGEKVLFDASAPYYWAGFQLYGDWK